MKKIVSILCLTLLTGCVTAYAETTTNCPTKCNNNCWNQCQESSNCGEGHYCASTDCGTRCLANTTVPAS